MKDDAQLLSDVAQKMNIRRDVRFMNYEVVSGELGVCLELGARAGERTAYWNPLRAKAHAFELMVLFKIDLKFYDDHVVAWFDGGFIGTGRIPYGDNSDRATMRAICLAVSELDA